MTFPAWLQRWQQQRDDELVYQPMDLTGHPDDWHELTTSGPQYNAEAELPDVPIEETEVDWDVLVARLRAEAEGEDL